MPSEIAVFLRTFWYRLMPETMFIVRCDHYLENAHAIWLRHNTKWNSRKHPTFFFLNSLAGGSLVLFVQFDSFRLEIGQIGRFETKSLLPNFERGS